ncbi:hypothetical protein M441DRAFT_431522 [Trichoderma asperellum CBS 433.97]|uniref:Uncharacterized protein n=1 Tax=Trichoderma asperellum (strain ATCC 204424 / CBS 433.97 / NBRC 101777) TaxID=1042311 RepID=A0A2T3Z6G0_TRIA4|nr:hypothetical protein M441DRAFT_431522 [Trichoderma asperellum CBS 433.97]PTB40393.1 hypothetical protein M441DRAFT_431522 [Trichoderma asperellum CBS 433.97]
MTYLDPPTIQWIVAVVKHYYTSLRDIECQIDIANGEIALLRGQMFEIEGQIEGNIPITQAQVETIKTMEDWINEAKRTIRANQAFQLRSNRVGNIGTTDVVSPSLLPLPNAYLQNISSGVENGSSQRFIDTNQLDGEQKDGHDCDSCYLCMEEAKQDSLN